MSKQTVSAQEWERVVAFMGPKVNYPTGLAIHQLVESKAQEFPGHIAVVYQEDSLTYQELDKQANQLAHLLVGMGVGPESFVGVSVDRSVQMIVSVLAVLKAGGAYIPLEPAFPRELLAFMLEDSQPQVVITSSVYSDKLSVGDVQLVLIDHDMDKIMTQPVTAPTVEVGERNVAYAIYTSGSTGKRKAALIEHRSIVNAYFAWRDAYDLSENDVALQTASFSFDVFTGDWVRTLCSGGTLVINPFNLILDPDEWKTGEGLYNLMRRHGVTIGEFTPPVLRKLLRYAQGTEQDLSFMRILMVGADAWYMAEHRDLVQFCDGKTRLANSYGMTEATVDSTYCEIYDIPHELDQMSIIGQSFANTESFILNANENSLVPVGAVGEICVAGPGLARGYLNRPELTEARFFMMDFPDGQQRRMYRSGDLGRFLPDGNIEFLGRKDNQVELGSIRVELGEIEAAVQLDPAVKASTVVIVGDSAEEHELVSFVTLQDDAEFDEASLRQDLEDRIPGYMIPHRFIVIESMPLTSNGKTDRKALANMA